MLFQKSHQNIMVIALFTKHQEQEIIYFFKLYTILYTTENYDKSCAVENLYKKHHSHDNTIN